MITNSCTPILLAFVLCVGAVASPLSAQSTDQKDQAKQDTDRNPNRRAQDQERRRRGQDVAQQEGQFQIPADVQFVPDVVYAAAKSDEGEPIELLMDVAFKKVAGDDALPAIVYIHGGGFRAGSREQGRGFAVNAARAGYVGVSIDYRLAGQAKFPAAVHDCKAAIRFLCTNAEDLGIDPDRIGVWGHSAGGHLSAMLATSGNSLDMEGDVGVTDVSSAVACAVDIAGPTDFVRMINTPQRGTVENWLGSASGEDFLWKARSASPTTYLDADDPPLMIMHGTDDETVPFNQAELFHDAAQKAGVAVEFVRVRNAGHSITERREMLQVGAFFDRHLGGTFAETIAPGRRNRQRDRVSRDGDNR